MQLLIPKAHRAALIRFLRFSPAEMVAFVNSLGRASAKVSLYPLARQLTNQALPFDSALGIVRFLVSLYRVHSESGVSRKEFVKDFIDAAKEEVQSLSDFEKINWGNITRNFTAILSAKPLALTAKASELSAEHQRRLCSLNSRILSDARPVFAGDPSEGPSAILIQHEFKIAYHENDEEVKEFYVTMDGDDLFHLFLMLERAEEKEKSLRKLIKKSGVQVLSDNEESE